LVSHNKAKWALLAPLIWLLFHRLWLELMAYLLFTIVILIMMVAYPNSLFGYLLALPSFYFLLDGNELVAKKLERKGWQFAGVFEGSSRDDAEFRFLANLQEISDMENRQQNIMPHSNLTSFKPKTPIGTGLFPE